MSIIKNIGIITIAICSFALAQAPGAVEAKSESVTQAMSDSSITASIKAKYLIDGEIKGLEIHVKTVNGKVMLTGEVPNAAVEEHAILVALNTDGVKEVISRLKLK